MTETHVVTAPDPSEVVADTAALAANSAERAQAAAADAIDKAQSAAAGLAVVAAEETRQSEERLAEWQNSIAQQHEKLSQDVTQQGAEMRAALTEALDKITSIQSRLDSPQASQASREGEPSGETPPPAADPPAPEPEKPAERRKAHRWI